MYIKVVSRLSLASVAYDSSTVALYGPSVVHVSAQTSQVKSVYRQGNDLVMTLDGGQEIIRIQDYFAFSSDGENANELVLDSGDQLAKYSFSETELTEEELLAGENQNGILLSSTVEPVADIDELLVGESDSLVSSLGNWLGSLSPTAWGIGLGGILLAGGAAVALMDDDDDSNHLEKDDSSPDTPTTPAPVTLDAVMDDQGDNKGALKDGDRTDDHTPTFKGTGEPGASIQINDSDGETLASTQVAEDGTWSVSLPTQEDGDHQYQVVQIVGEDVQQGDSISLTIGEDAIDPDSSSDPVLAIDPVSDDDVVGTNELEDGISISGSAEGVDAGSTMIITLNGKSYNTELNTDGSWEIELPGETLTNLSAGEHELMLTVVDDAGESHSIQRTLLIESDTLAMSASSEELSIDLSELLDNSSTASHSVIDAGHDPGHDAISAQSSSFDMAALLEGASLPLM